MLAIVLFQPEIPPNTGNIIRLCANIGAELHLVKPLGFDLNDKALRRAGLDYHEYASVRCHENWQECVTALAGRRVLACTTHGSRPYADIAFQPDDVLLFGCETRGLPADIRNSFPPEQRIRIPMRPDQRSLNLSNAAAIIAYEAWRQNGFSGGA